MSHGSSFRAGVELRIQHLASNIQQDLDLLKAYEDELRLADDPRTRARFRRNIDELRQSSERYQREYDDLQAQASKSQPQQLALIGAQLHEMDSKLDSLLV